MSFFLEQAGQGGVAGGAVVSKICHTAPDGCHCKCPRVYCGAVADQFAFDSVLLIGKKDNDKDDRGTFLGGSSCDWGCLVANKELDDP